MKNVRKLSATVILTLILACSAFAGDISMGVASSAAGDISGRKAKTSTFGDISSGLTQLLTYLGIVLR